MFPVSKREIVLVIFKHVAGRTYGTNSKTTSFTISITKESVSSGYSHTVKRVENTTRSGVFVTKFQVFGKPMKH